MFKHLDKVDWDKIEEKDREIQDMSAKNKAWKYVELQKSVPAIYREPFKKELSGLNPEIISFARSWHPESVKGIGLCGHSGLGKTRLLARLILKYRGMYLHAADLAQAVRDQTRFDALAADTAESTLKSAKHCRVLLLDDIGMEAPTQSVAEALAKIIEFRTANKKPILWTTNLKGAEMEAHFKARGDAITRRLLEFSTVFSV